MVGSNTGLVCGDPHRAAFAQGRIPHEAVQANHPPRAKIHMNCFPCLVSNIYDIKPASINSGTKVPMAGQGEGHDDWLSSKEK